MNTNLYAPITTLIAASHRLLGALGGIKVLLFACACLGFIGSGRGQAAPLDLIESFEAIPYNGISFPDPIIAVGPSSLVTMVNWKIVVFDKKGTKFFEQSLNGSSGFWGAQGAPGSVAEPWVIFDPNSGRFIASAADFGSTKGFLYFAVSKTATPISSSDWHKYRLNRSGTHQGAGFAGVSTYPDSAKVGVDGDAIYVTSGHWAKDLSITMQFSHAEIFALAKAPLLSGGPLQIVYNEPVITGANFFMIQPAIVFEPAPAMYFVQAKPTQPDDEIVVHTITDVLTAPVRTIAEVPVAPFDRPLDVPQLGSSILLLNIDARLTSATVRNGSLWTSHAIRDPAVDAESLVRWYQFDIASFPGAVALAQSGKVDPGPGIHTWLPHINVDATDNMALGFSMGGPNQNAAIGYTGRLASDAPGTTLAVHIAHAGQSYVQEGWAGRADWGEYSGLAIDPDGCTFWQFHEYPTSNHRWNTFVSAFQVDPCPVATIASDGFESGNFSGGSGNWVGAWTATGDTSILTSSGPAVGARHTRLRRNTGFLRRAANASGAATVRLAFWAKVDSFEGSDRANVLVSSNGANFTVVHQFTSTAGDGRYHYYEFDLSGFLPASQLHIAFDAEMNATNDEWYLDDIRLLETQ